MDRDQETCSYTYGNLIVFYLWKILELVRHSKPVRLEAAPTGPGENIELPNYFLKPHLDCDPSTQTNSLRYVCQITR